MEKLFTLLELQRRAQEALDLAALAHLSVNETHKLVSYTQALLWMHEDGVFHLEKASGNAILDDTSLYSQSILNELRRSRTELDSQKFLAREPEPGRYVVIVPFRTQSEGLLGGLWLERDKAFQQPEHHLLEELAITYAHALALLKVRAGRKAILPSWGRLKKSRKYILAACVLLALCPSRLTVSAPAEIIARDADIITVPYDGTLEKILVEPGATVTKGQVVAQMENSALSAQMDTAQQALRVTESSLARLSRQSLAAPEKKSELTAAEAEIEAKRLQLDYAQSLQEKSEIRASRDGVAVFSDRHLLQGKPMATGERVMMIADTEQYQVLVRVPSDSMLVLDQKGTLDFHLNVSPMTGYSAAITSIGYQASPDPDGLLTYKIIGQPLDALDLRIGWKGIARVHGGWTVLGYAVLRKPLAALRRMTGL